MTAPATQRYDVLGLGCTAVDDVLFVPAFPSPDKKVQITRRSRHLGGLTAVALITAARSGAHCGYAGCLGYDELSNYVAQRLGSEGVDVGPAPRLPEAGTIHSTIVVGEDTGSRNIFYEASGLIGAHDSLPQDKVFQDTAVLFIDHFGMPGNLRAAQLARAAGASIVADFEDASAPHLDEVLGWVDHLILSEEFALGLTGTTRAPEAVLALAVKRRAATIVTCGVEGCWSSLGGQTAAPRHHPAFAVKATDTTGCGDVFHGAYAAGVARREPLDQCIRYATAAAALKAMRGEIPHRMAVEQFLEDWRSQTESAQSP